MVYCSFLHSGARGAVPIRMMLDNSQAVMINADQLPDAEAAVADFEGNGGHLTIFSTFGDDPLQQNPPLIAQRESEFSYFFPDFSEIFHTVVTITYSERVYCVL